MKKNVKVNYPKPKPKIRLEDLGDVKEPERYSMYHILMENLKLAKRATYLHRIIYTGHHTFDCYDKAKKVFQQIITKCNETYCIEKLTGFLLYYPEYFVHMVESDEDNLNKHLKYLLQPDADHSTNLGKVKLLIHVSHINQRFIDGWASFTGIPSKLLEKLDVEADLQSSARFIYNCIKRIYMLISNYSDDQLKEKTDSHTKSLENSSVSTFDRWKGSSLLYTTSFMTTQDKPGQSQKDYVMFLPEYELLDFAIKSNFTMPLSDYYNLYGVVPMRDIYKDRVWPVPHDFIPYDIFETPFDCLVEFPREMRESSVLFKTSSTLISKNEASSSHVENVKGS
ncbi:uncharacterized protein LOC143191307 [Rhynchophorus ferrugineus]|uniref:BLUF domain-containing protein n=1 Tax=Rhynchophorus ferrugineus TaxID=354439 RepID=A0A834IZS7_RHYFE|nr:hypothetical protein GWI33_001710 [Rhynchophorus ferrugineus]